MGDQPRRGRTERKPGVSVPYALLGIALSVGLIWLAVGKIDLHEGAAALGRAQLWPWLPCAMAAYACGHLLRGVRCAMLVRHRVSVSFLTAANVVVFGYGVNNVLPGRLGEFARSAMLSQRTALPYAQSLVITFTERVLDAIAIAVLFVGCAAITGAAGDVVSVGATAASFIGVVAVVLFVAVFYSQRLPALVAALPSSISRRLTGLSLELASALTALRHPLTLGLVAIVSAAVWLMEGMMFWLLFPALGFEHSVVVGMLVMAATNLGILLPGAPGYVGTFHYFAMQSLVLFGAPADEALAYAFIVHICFFSVSTVWGGGVLAATGLRLGRVVKFIAEARSVPAKEAPSIAPPPLDASIVSDRPASPQLVALVEAWIPWDSVQLSASSRKQVLDRVARFVGEQLQSLPPKLRMLHTLGITLITTLCALRYVRPFASLPLSRRTRYLTSRGFATFAIPRKLLKVSRSLTLLGFFEEEAVQAAMSSAAPTRLPLV